MNEKTTTIPAAAGWVAIEYGYDETDKVLWYVDQPILAWVIEESYPSPEDPSRLHVIVRPITVDGVIEQDHGIQAPDGSVHIPFHAGWPTREKFELYLQNKYKTKKQAKE